MVKTGINVTQNPVLSSNLSKNSKKNQKRCEICPREKDKNLQNQCSKCDSYLCQKQLFKLF